MKGKILKWIIFIWGAISLFAFVSVRFQPLFNAVLKEKIVENYWDKTKYGELYYFNMIRHFREKGLPPAKQKFEYSAKHASVKNADILTFGDSFFEFSRITQIPERLANDFHKKVHYVNNDQPLDYLEKNNYHDTVPKLVIFERVERYIPVAFEKEQTIHPYKIEKKSETVKVLTYIKDKIFYKKSEELYDAMLKRSYLTTDIYSCIATLKFDLLGKISSLTPAYLKNGNNSWLFYYDQVNDNITSFYYQFSDAQIDSICDHMADLQHKLLKKYNMRLVYLPLPAKYTLYHYLINNDTYNNFLPRLYDGLRKRNVDFVNVYEDFKNSPEILYYHTDSHWNQKGSDMAYNKMINYLYNDSTLKGFLK